MPHGFRCFASVVLASILCAQGVRAGAEDTKPARVADLVQLGLEDLMNIRVTSVSRRSELLSDAAASIFVISAEDIRRSGATTLPEVLRLAANLHVAQVHAVGFAISARGFNNNSANKLLVLIDGRSVYTPLFSGVFWDVQDVMLEDVDRIEVISGPGGTLWGVNAVNGVINVIRRSAKDSQGTLVLAGAGDRTRIGAVRQGGSAAGGGHYRVYGKYSAGSHTETAAGIQKNDGWHQTRGGLRADWERGRDQLMLEGNAYSGAEGQPLPGSISITGVNLALDTITVAGVNLNARWSRRREDGSGLTVQAYYDRTERTVPPTFAETLDLFDVQFQHALRPAGRHSIAWGAEYRHGMDRLTNSAIFGFLPANVDQRWPSVFAQDEVTLRRGLKLTVGARIERNDYTGNEYLPNARLAWKPAPAHLVWTAASRTVRAPSRLDRDAYVPSNPPFLLAGGAAVRSETANVFEVGYRGSWSTLSLSATAFHGVYDHLRTQEIAPSRTSLFFGSGMEGTTTGVEVWGTVQARPRWRLSGGFAGLREQLRLRPGSNDAAAVAAQEGRDPARNWRLRSSLDFASAGELDVTVRGVSRLSMPVVASYAAVDVRLGWRTSRDLDVSLTLQNLFDPGHAEFSAEATRSEIERSVFLQLLWRPSRDQ